MQQVRYLLRQATWADSPSRRVFRDDEQVVIVPGSIDRKLFGTLRYPAAIVSDGGGTPHEEHPTLLVPAVISLTILQEHFGDPYGAAALIGAQRTTTSGDSSGRGLWELYPPVIEDLVRKGREVGLSMVCSSQTDSGAIEARPGEHQALVAKEWRLEMPLDDVEAGEYPTVGAVTAAVGGSTVTLTWASTPPARYDNPSRYAAVVRKSGSAPTSITDGTSISTTASSGITNSPGAGTWYYGVASIYDERDGDRYGALMTSGAAVVP